MPKKKAIRTKKISSGCFHIHASMNGTIISFSDVNGNVLGWASSGSCGFKNAKRGTAYAAQLTAEKIIQIARASGVQSVAICICGPGQGRDPVVRVIAASGISVSSIRDITPRVHNGCRPKKIRRM
jgi:small subunit ribosomal protein S11